MKKTTYLLLFALSTLFSSCKDSGEKNADKGYPETQAWWNDQVFYQLFIRSFYDSNGDGIGDLQGVIQKLDYLNDGNPATDTDLGVTALMLMPIFKATGYDGYDVEDYLEVDPEYGTKNDLQQLLSLASQRGIRVVLDFPINHTSVNHPWFVQASSENPGSLKNWYIWKSTNPGDYSPYGGPLWHASGNEYYYALFSRTKPDLNFKNEEVTNAVKEISEFWIKEEGVDGFRMEGAGALIEEGDAIMFSNANLVWWRDYFSFVRNLDPSFLLIGDVPGLTTIAAPYADDRLDFCYEYELSSSIFNGIKNQSTSAIREKMIDVINRYPNSQYGVFLTNQFQNRTIDILEDGQKAKLAASILLTLPGVPFIYYGEEIGLSGTGLAEEIRRPMQWSNELNAGFSTGNPWFSVNTDFAKINVDQQNNDANSLLNHYKKLIKIRKTSQGLSKGSFEPVKSNDSRIFSYFRITSTDVILVIHNLSGVAIESPTLFNSDGSQSAATYTGVYLPSEDPAPNLNIQGGGSFAGYIPVTTLNPYSTILIRFNRREQ